MIEATQMETKPSTAAVGKGYSSKESLVASSENTSSQYKNDFKQNTANHYDYQGDAIDSWKNERIQ